jgi:hypothetical protein
VLSHRDDGVRIARENARAADSVDSFFEGLIAFTEVRAEKDGSVRINSESFDSEHQGCHVLAGVLLAVAQDFVQGINE